MTKVWEFANHYFVLLLFLGTIAALAAAWDLFSGLRKWSQLATSERFSKVVLFVCAVAGPIILCGAAIGPYFVGNADSTARDATIAKLQQRLTATEALLRNARAVQDVKSGTYLKQIDVLQGQVALLTAELQAAEISTSAQLQQSHSQIQGLKHDDGALHRQLDPRTITSDQASRIAAVARSAGTIEVHLSSTQGNPEAATFAQQLGLALQTGGWHIVDFSPNTFEAGENAPVMFFCGAEIAACNALANGLRGLGFAAVVRENETLQRGNVNIFVGPKG